MTKTEESNCESQEQRIFTKKAMTEMANNSNVHLDRSISLSSRVAPVSILDFSETSSVASGTGDVEFSGRQQEAERIPEDAWLPVTESRKGNMFTATSHLVCSGIGFQALLLPTAFISLGWTWGIICLSMAYLWQLYTTWLLVDLHESAPQPGIRYSRYLHLSVVAFGPKLGKLLSIFPTMYLSTGTCIFYLNAGGTAMEALQQIMCDNNVECKANALKTFQWFLVFICIAVLIAHFFPNLISLAPVSFIGSITGIAFCTLLWILSIVHGNRTRGTREVTEVGASESVEFRDVINSVAIIMLAFRGHNLILEIQGTMPTNYKVKSDKPMRGGVVISNLLIAVCLFPLAIVGHWAYSRDKVNINEGILVAFIKSHQNHTSRYITGGIYFIIIANYLCTFQIYAIASFDNLERIYASKKSKPCPRMVRSIIKVIFGGFIYFIAVFLPFLPKLAILIGSMALPLTLVYPCFMWLSIKIPLRFSRMWCLNLGLGSLGIVISVIMFIAAVWSLVVEHFHANFFNP